MAKFWSLLRGVTLWTLWIVRNDQVFNQCRWLQAKIEQIIRQGLVDYGSGDWIKTFAKITKNPSTAETVLARFDESWTSYESICNLQGMKVKWQATYPTGIG